MITIIEEGMDHINRNILVIGAGLAGSEAAYFLAQKGYGVILAECKKESPNPAQKLSTYAELVCTNSLKSQDACSAHGLLKHEMAQLGSLILEMANESKVPAGHALAVDRVQFSELITKKLCSHDNITIIEQEIIDPIEVAQRYDCQQVIIASGPLTTDALSGWIQEHIAGDDFYFYDAIAPVVEADSLDMGKIYAKDRYEDDKEEPDYLNIPLNKDEYLAFIDALLSAKKAPAHNFEQYKFFESCLPIDVMAERGVETARFSCMKPVGLRMSDGTRPYAVVQLRKENLLGSAYNMVGFQTRLTYGEQRRIFRMLPGMENATFAHLGSVHRNSYIQSSKHLNFDFSSKEMPNIFFAGQIAGVEGYTESAAMGLYVALQLHKGSDQRTFPIESAIGALVNYVMGHPKANPSNINFGLLPEIVLTKEQRKNRRNRKMLKKEFAVQRAHVHFEKFYKEYIMTEV